MRLPSAASARPRASSGAGQELLGVERPAELADLEMQDWLVGVAGADLGDLLAALDHLLLLHEDLAGMGIDGQEFIAVLDDEQLAQPAYARADVCHLALGGSHDRVADPAVDVDALAARLLERGEQLPLGRPDELQRVGVGGRRRRVWFLWRCTQ